MTLPGRLLEGGNLTPSQLLATVRNQAYETTAGFWGDSEIYSYMWQGEIILAQKIVGLTQTTTTDTTVASTREYDRPSGAIRINRLTWDSQKLKKIGLNDLEESEGSGYGFTGSDGDPIYYYESGAYVGLSPIPDTANTIKYWYDAKPTAIDASSTAFTVVDYEEIIADYCLYRMYLKDQDNRADVHLSLWQDSLVKSSNDWNRRNSADKITVVRDTDAAIFN